MLEIIKHWREALDTIPVVGKIAMKQMTALMNDMDNVIRQLEEINRKNEETSESE